MHGQPHLRATQATILTVEFVSGRVGRHCRERSICSYAHYVSDAIGPSGESTTNEASDDEPGRMENLGLRTLRKEAGREKRVRLPNMEEGQWGNCISEQLRRKAAVEVMRVGCAAYDAIPPRAIYSDTTI